MPKINQIIAVLKGKKTQTEKKVTECYHLLQKTALFNGKTRTYRPKDDDGEQLPNEIEIVRHKVNDVISQAVAAWEDLFNVMMTQEVANTTAKADIVLPDGYTVLPDVPVTMLLFLEKRLQDVITFISHIPILEDGTEWSYSEEEMLYVSNAVETTRTKKVPKVMVLYEATKEHPAQVQAYNEDVLVGYWSTRLKSGVVAANTKAKYLKRANDLLEAVKKSREEANSKECVPYDKAGGSILDYIFS